MKFSEQWLREWVNPDINTEELVSQITMAGLEVDGVELVAGEFVGVVVGEVLSTEKHPDADKLSVCQVSAGDETFQVVCGAPNVRAGLKVPFATIGAVLPGNFKIKKAKLRGVESQGMLCAEAELGMSDASDGLMELPVDAPTGQDFREYMNLNDRMIEVDLTPNRSDCLSIAGLAREVGVLNKILVDKPKINAVVPTIKDTFPINVDAPACCPRYIGRVIKDINVNAESPLWMQEKLRRSGLRSIDPVVDVTNYILLEFGQPMHAFDLDKLSGSINVRMANDNEKITLLDGQEVELRSNTLVIADEAQALAIAGVMGGEYSAVSENTTNIFLECAFFEPISIAGKARSYGLHTDSSHRFERGVDYKLQSKMIERATELLLEIVGGNAGPISENVSTSDLPSRELVELRYARVESLLGLKIDKTEVEEILTRLGLHVDKLTKDGWLIKVPSYRFDISIEADLIEEVGRIYGYNNLPVTQPVGSLALKPCDESITPIADIQNHLVTLGYQEAITYSFVDPELQQKLDPENEGIALANPISADLSVMRTSLWTGLLKALLYNQNRQQDRVRLFETGLRFVKKGDDIDQSPMLAGVVSGSRLPENWTGGRDSVDFFDVKADLESLLSRLGSGFEFKKGSLPALHPGQAAEIVKNGEIVGYLGALHPEIHKSLNLNGSVYLFELCLNQIVKGNVPQCKEFSKFPEVRRDLAIIVNKEVQFNDVRSAIIEKAGDFLIDLNVFDVYQGQGVEPGKKSLAIGVTWQHVERTLNDDEITQTFNDIIDVLKDRFGAILRS
ncbi:phenylalanine--tRNA ligase subunit beta [Alkalimarinus sediminis]|uniref:Phenylalanine--tRNA ligase beta subunit n=1 Tax=Alkalimarinus sediminis TaxID=1632866 RepID=A0A9E8KK49_9ALTE|nr:phenylalanine--tRNA ligase subunit beta [Alkalimarinus sediminis]UZW75726.1 phenylalanine--tRNA ligase subunit beta [Alkalimarinus sediminis]